MGEVDNLKHVKRSPGTSKQIYFSLTAMTRAYHVDDLGDDRPRSNDRRLRIFDRLRASRSDIVCSRRRREHIGGQGVEPLARGDQGVPGYAGEEEHRARARRSFGCKHVAVVRGITDTEDPRRRRRT
jgi:hypothetical protein